MLNRIGSRIRDLIITAAAALLIALLLGTAIELVLKVRGRYAH